MKSSIRVALAGWLPTGYLSVAAGVLFLGNGSLNGASPAEAVDYAEPARLIGHIYPIGAVATKLLYRSERRSARSGSAVNVTCDYTYPNGSLAARDLIVYRAGQLDSFEEELLQTNEKGGAAIRPDPKNPARSRIYFEYTACQNGQKKTSSGSELLEKDTLIDDMIPAFIELHWNTLAGGASASFRYIVLSRKETVGFKLVKDSDVTCRGKPALRIKMAPTSLIIAALVDPLYFVVEKTGTHRILEYTGRTTPLIKDGSKWKDLDAVSVFEWDQPLAKTGPSSVPVLDTRP